MYYVCACVICRRWGEREGARILKECSCYLVTVVCDTCLCSPRWQTYRTDSGGTTISLTMTKTGRVETTRPSFSNVRESRPWLVGIKHNLCVLFLFVVLSLLCVSVCIACCMNVWRRTSFCYYLYQSINQSDDVSANLLRLCAVHVNWSDKGYL